MNIVKRQQADDDIVHYVDYFRQKSGPTLAVRFLEAAERTLASIARFPGIGSYFPLANPGLDGLRAFPIDGFPIHIIFYLWPSAEEIVVVRVMNASRNLARHLESTHDDNR